MINRFFHTLLITGALLRPDIAHPHDGPVNILLFTADDLDRNSLGCYGSEVPDISPSIDQFAKEGIRFNHAYVNYSICAPSRAILATGLYGHNSGVMGFMKMDSGSKIPLILELLRERGYQVGVLSKVDHSTPKESFQWDLTVEQSELGMGRSPTLYYQKAVEFFNSCKLSGKPFYFMVNSDDPHRPFFNPYEPLRSGIERPSRIYRPEEVPVPGFLPDLPQVRKEISFYYNSVKRLDDTFGKVMQALDDCGFRGNTLVIFMSDNGIALPFAKCNNYYASCRTPWIARYPGVIAPGQVNDKNFIAEVDYMPTILQVVGISPPNRLDGTSCWPLYVGQDQKNTGIIYSQIDFKAKGKPMPLKGSAVPMRGLITEDYLYIFNAWVNGKRIYANNNEGLSMEAMENAAQSDLEIAKRVHFFRYRITEEFYNLIDDPDCMKNLINDQSLAKQINKMRKKLVKFMRKTNDPLLNIYRKRYRPEKSIQLLYEIYPELKNLDEGIVTSNPRWNQVRERSSQIEY